jgi:predicted pyridoxine 5'-phosphate oxidase superfamily flavin-nucleotide-binding protein
MAVTDHLVTTIEQLEAVYGEPYGPAVAKEIDYISAGYSKLIEAAPFVAIATGSSDGFDCSP